QRLVRELGDLGLARVNRRNHGLERLELAIVGAAEDAPSDPAKTEHVDVPKPRGGLLRVDPPQGAPTRAPVPTGHPARRLRPGWAEVDIRAARSLVNAGASARAGAGPAIELTLTGDEGGRT